MCKPELTKKPAVAAATKTMLSKSPPSGILSVGLFEKPPPMATLSYYVGGILAFLMAIEYGLVCLFDYYKHLHPLLEIETNRLILARHLGTDWFCCAFVALLGLTSFPIICPEFFDAARGNKSAIPKGGFESRMFTYHPAAFRMCLFFFSYQIKNMYDTIVWHDGPEFVAHHIMCMLVGYGCIVHGVAHFHAPFYFGISEISTAVLCLLANFDDEHGVPGLADAWPEGKVFFGALFAVTFLICRVVLWTFFSYYFVHDAMLAINSTDSSRDAARPWNKVFLGSLTGLSVLQVIWLGQIILIGKEEIEKAMGVTV